MWKLGPYDEASANLTLNGIPLTQAHGQVFWFKD